MAAVVIPHVPGAGNGEHTVAAQGPDQVVAAGGGIRGRNLHVAAVDCNTIVVVVHAKLSPGRLRIAVIDVCQRIAVVDGQSHFAGQACGDRQTGQAKAAVEHTISNVRHALRDRDTAQARAIVERLVPDAGHAHRDRDRSQAVAAGERFVPDARHALRDRDVGHARAVHEGKIPNAGHALQDADSLDLLPAVIPGCRTHQAVFGTFFLKVPHVPAACNGENPRAAQGPDQAVAALAGGHGVLYLVRRGRQSVRLVLRGRQSVRVGLCLPCVRGGVSPLG